MHPTRKASIRVFGALLPLILFLTAPAQPQQILSPWNRKVEGIAVRPATPGSHTLYTVQAVLSVRAGATSVPLDLSTQIETRVNGEPIDVAELKIRADSGPSANCAAACAEVGQPCVCVENLFCGCGNVFVLGVPVGVSLSPGDEITVILYPAPGAKPEFNDGDDDRSLKFSGRETTWERRVTSIEKKEVRDGLYDVRVSVGAKVNFDGKLDLDTEMTLLVNGKRSASELAPFDNLIWAACTGACEGAVCAKLNSGDAGAACVKEEHINGPTCYCNTDSLGSHVFEGIALKPGDEVSVMLFPARGALPDLPPTKAETPASTPVFLRGDAGGNGAVEMADAIFILGWQFLGSRGPDCPDAADVNDDGQVNIGDPIELLSGLFLGGSPPPPPGPFDCGVDPTEDKLLPCDYDACLTVH